VKKDPVSSCTTVSKVVPSDLVKVITFPDMEAVVTVSPTFELSSDKEALTLFQSSILILLQINNPLLFFQ
jgi:hypothetical protein